MRHLVNHAQVQRSYGCSFGDGNPYDFIVVTVVDSSTLLLCAPCFVRTALEMVQALTEPDTLPPDALRFMAHDGTGDTVPGPGAKKRGRNAPAETEDPDLFEAFDGVILADELGDEFR